MSFRDGAGMTSRISRWRRFGAGLKTPSWAGGGSARVSRPRRGRDRRSPLVLGTWRLRSARWQVGRPCHNGDLADELDVGYGQFKEWVRKGYVHARRV